VSDRDFLTGSSRSAPPDLRVAAIARRQHGLITIAQLRAAGLNTAAVAKRVDRSVLHRVGRGVYAVGHASLSRDAQWMRAVLEAGR
jgi:predicted transcriptional regulator of viral defense system